MEQVTEDERKKIEPTEFTMFLDNPLNPKVMHVTIPIQCLLDIANRGENIVHVVGAHMFAFGVRAIKTVSVLQAKLKDTGVIKPGGRKLEVH